MLAKLPMVIFDKGLKYALTRPFQAERMLAKLPMVDLYEERALILSKLGEHQQVSM